MANANAKSKKNTPATDPIAEAEKALAEARDLLVQRQKEAETAREKHEELRARLSRGDDSVTAEDMVRAQFEIDRTAGLINAAKAAIDKAEKNLAAAIAEHEPLLAEWVAEAIKANGWTWGLYGVPVHLGKPGKDAEAPSAWLYQEAPATADRSGALSGNVTLVVVTPGGEHIEDMRPMIDGAQKLARAADGEVNAHSGRHAQGSSLRLTFRGVRAGLPVLPMRLSNPKDAARALLCAIVDAGAWEWRPVGSLNQPRRLPAITGDVARAEVIHTEVDGREIIRTIDATLVMRKAGREHVEKVAAAMPGKWAPGAGVFVSAEVLDWSEREITGWSERWSEREITRTYGLIAIESTVRVRLVLRARLAR